MLPLPDEFGNYWLGERGQAPAIFPHKEFQGVGKDRKIVRTGVYTLSLTSGFLRSGGGERIFFRTPELALQALNDMTTIAEKHGA